jgi:plastocyanin
VAPPPAAPAGPAPQGPAGAPGAAVKIAGFAFGPASVTVAAGQTVTWTNADRVPHTVTADGGAWNSGPLAPGASFSFTPTRPGTYAYHCSIHPFMRGTVVVAG